MNYIYKKQCFCGSGIQTMLTKKLFFSGIQTVHKINKKTYVLYVALAFRL